MSFPLFPHQATPYATRVDTLFLTLIGLSVFFVLLVTTLLIVFAVRYRRDARVNRTMSHRHATALEITWTVIPTILALSIFVWAASLYFDYARTPEGAMEILVTGKQWMWKVQHPNGRREIDELHVPMGQPIKLTMTSEDVIHSFFIPAFRIKKDVLPGRYTSEWFTATRPGEYHLFCAEYCGTDHSRMRGTVYVMDPGDYEAWRSGAQAGLTPADAGQELFSRLGCATCHQTTATGRGPSLVGVFGSQVKLQSGETITADEDYVRESILSPQAKLVATYPPIMPTFRSQLSQDDLFQLVAYVKSLGKSPSAAGGGS